MGLNAHLSQFPASMQEAMEALPLPVAMIDAHATLIYSNRAWSVLFREAPALGARGDYVQIWQPWNSPAVLDRLRTWLQKAMSGAPSESAFEIAYDNEAGSATLQLQAAPIQSGTQPCLLLTHLSRRQHEPLDAMPASPSHSDALFRRAFQTFCIGSAILDLDGTMKHVNRSFCRLTGHLEQELLATCYHAMIHADDLTLWHYEMQRLIRNELPRVQITHRMQHRNGRMVWVLLSASLLRDEQEQPQHIIAQVQDISDRYRAEEELRRQALTFESISDGVILVRQSGVILDWNPAAGRILGPSRDEALGTDIRALIAPESFRTFDLIQQHLHRGQRWEGEIRLRRGDGSHRVCECVAAPLMEEESGAVTAMYFLRDVTEARRLETQLQQAQKMEAVGQLAGGVAHDFNNLLTVVKGQSVLLLEEMSSDSLQRQRVLQIGQAADRAADLTRQLLAYSRRQVLAPRLFDLNTVVGNLAPMLRRLINEAIEVEIRLDEIPLWVKADAGQIDQVILNLAVNARDAIPQQGKITIESSLLAHTRVINEMTLLTPGDFAVLSVRDTGVGMSPEVQAHIFDPFFTTKAKGQGTGLGLATVYGIVRQSGGHIQVSSIPGKGSSFDVYLPRVEAPREESAPSAETPAGPAAHAGTILVVEDEEGVRSLICDVLSQMGYQVLEAAGSAEALHHASHHSGTIDLMVTDVVMPHMGGRELAQRMASLRPRMRVLYISGYADDAVVRHGVQESRMAFLQKPFSPSQLGQKIQEVLSAPVPVSGHRL